jgi:isoleucyl-tRNA synthetase
MLAPILVFTCDEIWENLPARDKSQPSVHLAELPKARLGDQDNLLANWDRLFEIRDQVLRALEEARVAKQIGSSLEAKVMLSASGEIFELLKSHEDYLRYIFIVSQVELNESNKGNDVSIAVSTADGQKCERCWNYSTKVGASDRYPTLCERCVAALQEIEQEGNGA